MSRIRSGVGAFCPRAVGLDLFFDEAVFFFFTDDCAAAEFPAPETIGAALTRSTAPRAQSHVLLFIGFLGRSHFLVGFK